MNDVHYKTLPKSVRIGCFVFDVVVGSELEHDISNSYGFMASTLKRISVRNGLSRQELANTFIHEVKHGINLVYGLMRNPDEPQPSEEDYTTLGSNGLCAFVQDNPKAFAWWVKLLKLEDVQ